MGQALNPRMREALLLGGLALALRLLWLGREPLWVDEAYSWHAARLPLSAILALQEQTPPLYNSLLHAWVGLAGDSEWALRLPSALFGAAAVAALYLLGCRLAGRGVAAFAAALLAVSAFHIHYSQEARTYALFSLTATLSLLAFTAMAQSGWRRHRVAYVVATAAMLYSHVYGLFFLLAQAVSFLGLQAGMDPQARRHAWKAVPALQAGSLALLLPWAGILVQRTRAVAAGFWIGPFSMMDAKDLAWSLAIRNGGTWIVRAGVLLVFGLLAFGAWRLRPWGKDATTRQTAWLLLPAATLPFALPLLVSAAIQPIFVTHYALPAWGLLYLLVAMACKGLPRPPRATVGVGALVATLFVANAAFALATPHNQDWRGLTRTLEAEAAAGALVVNAFGYCDSNSTLDYQCPLDYYGRRSDLRVHPFTNSYFRPITAQDLATLRGALAGAKEVWVVLADNDTFTRTVEHELADRGPPMQAWSFKSLRLARYASAVRPA
ncbi:MAG TPA: glycosyltransferase family 39 protein [Candidatus Thermoplasmatota archaeon]|nr:glycosyltransferase family 39 protein [Candidatus Thermoplasmatota archaeon]